MKWRSSNEIRRARPLLGTIVDLTCFGSCEAGFAAIDKVHRLMSFYEPTSDISRINRDAFRKSVPVHPWTWRVLNASQMFAEVSDGVFDIVAARNRRSSWRDIVLEKNRSVRFRKRITVDFGGIAKGFAVDRAVDALKRNGIQSGIVNAGGDLRVFGSAARDIHLRNPSSPTSSCGTFRICNRAVATSATYFAPRALIDSRTRRPMKRIASVTVAAGDCMTADALTKIVFALREKAEPILTRYGADALLLERNGEPCCAFQSPCDIRDGTR